MRYEKSQSASDNDGWTLKGCLPAEQLVAKLRARVAELELDLKFAKAANAPLTSQNNDLNKIVCGLEADLKMARVRALGEAIFECENVGMDGVGASHRQAAAMCVDAIRALTNEGAGHVGE